MPSLRSFAGMVLLRFGKNQYILGVGHLGVTGVVHVKLDKASFLASGCCLDNNVA